MVATSYMWLFEFKWKLNKIKNSVIQSHKPQSAQLAICDLRYWFFYSILMYLHSSLNNHMQLVTTNGHRYKAFLPLLRALSDSAALKATAEALRSAGRWCHPAQGKAAEMHHEPSFPVTFSVQRQQSFAKKKKKNKLPRDSSNPQPVNSWAEGWRRAGLFLCTAESWAGKSETGSSGDT